MIFTYHLSALKHFFRTFSTNILQFSNTCVQNYADINNGDLANIMSFGGLAQGVSFLLGGLILVALLGPRRSVFLGCFMFTLAPILTYVCLIYQARVEYLYFVYGVLSSASVALLTLVTKTLPVTWFPEHKGKVIGFIASGFGLSSTVFSPIQAVMVNPANVKPETDNSTLSKTTIFTDPDVLDNVPVTMLYMAAIYAFLFFISFIITVGAPQENSDQEEEESMKERLSNALSYVYKDAGRDKNFYLLWLARFLYLTVGSAVLAHWKTFSFTQSDNDQLVSVAGGLRCGNLFCLNNFSFLFSFVVDWSTSSQGFSLDFFLTCLATVKCCLCLDCSSPSTSSVSTMLVKTLLD